jgi:hypothetical protein
MHSVIAPALYGCRRTQAAWPVTGTGGTFGTPAFRDFFAMSAESEPLQEPQLFDLAPPVGGARALLGEAPTKPSIEPSVD